MEDSHDLAEAVDCTVSGEAVESRRVAAVDRVDWLDSMVEEGIVAEVAAGPDQNFGFVVALDNIHLLLEEDIHWAGGDLEMVVAVMVQPTFAVALRIGSSWSEIYHLEEMEPEMS